MVTRPACVLMDEPTGNLDQDTAASVQELMEELNQESGLSFVVVTHDRSMALTMDRVLELRQGRLQELSKTGGENGLQSRVLVMPSSIPVAVAVRGRPHLSPSSAHPFSCFCHSPYSVHLM